MRSYLSTCCSPAAASHLLLCILLLAFATMAGAQERIVVDVTKSIGTINPMLYGQFLEHIYDSVVNGLSNQRIPDPSFEEAPRTLGGGWRVHGGTWFMRENELVMESPVNDAHVFAGDRAWTDYSFSVEARKDAGSEGFLILFRVRDDNNFYWWNLGGWGNTFSAVEHEEEGQRRVLTETRTNTTIEEDRWYRIEIRVHGAEITCSLDGKIVCRVRDDTLVHGGIGLGSWSTAVRYRNAKVVVQAKEALALPAAAGDSISGAWRKFPAEDATVQCAWIDQNPFNSRYCQQVTVDKTWGGIALDGIMLTEREHYRLAVRMRGNGIVIARVIDGESLLAESRMAVAGTRWSDHSLEFTSRVTTDNATLQFEVRGPGTVCFDQCTLDVPETPFRKPILDRVAEIQPAFMRWPGGCYAEYYRWQDGIGPRDTRVTKPNYVWGGLDPNHVGTAEFIDLCRRTGAEPVIVLNIGHHDDPASTSNYIQEAVNWLEYCNGDATTEFGKRRLMDGFKEPFNITYWEIGNETWPMGVDAYAERAKQFVDALRAKQPGLKVLLCGSGGHNQDWNRDIIARAATHMDYLSVHHYMQGTFEEEMQNGVDYPNFLAETGALIAQSANPHIKIACTEWNQQSIALRTGIYAGLLLNGFETHGDVITMSCPALFIRRTNAPAWNNAFINHDTRNVFVAPNYLVMQLYRDHFQPMRVAVEAPASLNVVATYDPAIRAIVLKIVNPSMDRDVTAAIEVKGRDEVFEWNQWQVWSDSVDDANSIQEPRKIAVQQSLGSWEPTFPAHSVTVLRTMEGTIDVNALLTMNAP